MELICWAALRYRDFSIFFSVSRSSLTSNVQDVEAPKNTQGLIPGRRRSQCRTTEWRIDTKKEISIPKRRLRPPRYHKNDILIPKKDSPENATFPIRNSVVSIKFPPVILGPEMAAPILWAPGICGLSAGKPPCP